MERILITGVGGNVGQYVGKELASAGFEVIGVVRNKVPENVNYQLIKADISKEILEINNIDIIIHIAAGLSGTTEKLINDNIKGTENIIHFAEQKQVRKLIYMSTVSIHGYIEGELCIESDIINPDCYGITKYLCECMIKESKIPERFIIRLPRMLGPFVDLENTQTSGFLTMVKKILYGEDIICFIPKVKYNNYLHVAELGKFLINLISIEAIIENDTILLGAKEHLLMSEILQIMKCEIKSASRIILQDNGTIPKCSLVNIKKAEEYGFLPCDARSMLKKFIQEVYIRCK